MNYTDKYHLPQWEETDRIMRTDFNQMCADIESGIAEAKKKADEAYAPDYPPLVIGTYAGGGETETPVDVGFRPRFVLITGQVAGYEDTQVRCILATGPGLMISLLRPSVYTTSAALFAASMESATSWATLSLPTRTHSPLIASCSTCST